MKKRLTIVSLIIVIVSLFVACSENSGSEVVSTTAVTDSNGTTHYYEPVTDDTGNISTTAENKGVFEIETQSNGKAVTKKNGEYVTNEHTTVLPIENTTDNSNSATKKDGTSPIPAESSSTDNVSDADNTIEFKPDKPTDETKPTTTENPVTTTQKETQPATDKDGWITKWY